MVARQAEGSGASTWRDSRQFANLLQETQMIMIRADHAGYLPVGDSQRRRARVGHVFAGRSNGPEWALPLALVRARRRPNGCHAIPFCDLIRDSDLIVGEGRQHHCDNAARPFGKAGGHDFVENRGLALVVDLVKIAADAGFVLFS
jgi:hypothetical protein